MYKALSPTKNLGHGNNKVLSWFDRIMIKVFNPKITQLLFWIRNKPKLGWLIYIGLNWPENAARLLFLVTVLTNGIPQFIQGEENTRSVYLKKRQKMTVEHLHKSF